MLATSTNDVGGGLHMFSLGNADFIRLNGPFNLKNVNGITIRYADLPTGAPRVPGSALGNVRDAHGLRRRARSSARSRSRPPGSSDGRGADLEAT